MGMPTVSLALLSLGMGLPAAVQIMVVPTLVTNVWQALVGGALLRLVARFRTLLVAAAGGVWLGYALLFRTYPKAMTALLGAAIVLYSASALLNRPLMPRVRRERIASPVVGLTTGILAGATGNISMPAIAYLHQLDMPRNEVVQMLGILFSLGAAMLGLTVATHGDYEMHLFHLSAIAVIPGIIGMIAGQRVRKRLSERIFRRALFTALLLGGTHLLWKGLH